MWKYEKFYLSDCDIKQAENITELSRVEIEEIVGRFRSDHYRFAGKLRGAIYKYFCGKVEIRHHFTKKVIWEK